MDFQQDNYTGIIMQKIEELRSWQRQQQEKLLQQQEEQRLLLSNEQQRMYEVFGLQDMDTFHAQSFKSAVLPHFNKCLNSPKEKNPDDDGDQTPEEDECRNNRNELRSDLYVRKTSEHTPVTSPTLQSVMKDNAKKTQTLDDTPVVPLNKDFHQFLQEKLEQYGCGDNNHIEDMQQKPKRKFLRKGEGLARFRMKPTLLQPQEQSTGKGNVKRTLITNQPNSSVTKLGNPSNKSKKTASSSVTGSNRSNVKKKQSKNCVGSDKSHTAGLSKTSKSQYPKSAVPKLTLKRKETSPSVPTWANILQQQKHSSQNLQSQDGDSKVQHRVDLPQNGPMNDSMEVSFLEKVNDADKKNKKEVEELKIFELLEQHAANSSFCSTSSLVARLMDGSINSTPVKNYPLRTTHNHQNEKLTASLLHPHSQNSHSNQEQMLAGSHQFQNENTICEYLPYGLDNADSESLTNKGLANDHLKFGVYEENKSCVSKLTISSSNHWESSGGQTSLNTSSSSIGVTTGVNSPCNKHLHVRFAETNEYKSLSDVDTSFSSQGDSTINIKYRDNCENQKLETMNYEKRTDAKHFRDDQAWSDDCSCTSSEESSSPDPSLSTKCQTLTATHSPKPSTPHQTVKPQYQVCSTERSTDRFPEDVDKLSHGFLNNCADNVSHTDDQDETDFGVTTQSNSNSEITFKSALLRTRLEELEKEIQIFRKENTSLRKIQKKHEGELLSFNKERKELEKKMNEEKEKIQSFLQEERKKLNKERSVFEKYCKDLRNQPTKQEREEIQALKQQLADLQDEMHKKGSRWSATQVRTRDRLKQLEQENTQLKNEIEKLKKEKSQAKMVKSSTTTKSRGVSTTRMLHAINDHIAKMKPSDLEDSVIVHDVVPTKKIPMSVLQQQNSLRHKQTKVKHNNDTEINEWGDICNKAYQTYLNIPYLNPQPSTDELLGVKEDKTSETIVVNCRAANNSSQVNKDTVENELTNHHTSLDCVSYSSEEEDTEGNTGTSPHVALDNKRIHMAVYDAFYNTNPIFTREVYPETGSISKNFPSQQLLRNGENGGEDTTVSENRYEQSTTSGDSEVTYNSNHLIRTDLQKENVSLPSSGQDSNISSQQSKIQETQNSSTVSKPSSNREKVYSDGRKEILYPNGNLKKISADGSLTKMIYYNGDVKETLSDGTVKYFYAETKTWHTTYSNGLEILEFPDGQIERRQKDGTKEMTYPNATVRTCFPDGHEEWVFQDGVVVKVDSQRGEKVLLLPNGQREVQTKEHMRREYPDGTVKTVYPDGIQETRYANGRIRVKDKYGNLIMDSIMQRL